MQSIRHRTLTRTAYTAFLASNRLVYAALEEQPFGLDPRLARVAAYDADLRVFEAEAERPVPAAIELAKRIRTGSSLVRRTNAFVLYGGDLFGGQAFRRRIDGLLSERAPAWGLDLARGSGTAHRDFGVEDDAAFVDMRERFFAGVFEDRDELGLAIAEAERSFRAAIAVMDQCYARGVGQSSVEWSAILDNP